MAHFALRASLSTGSQKVGTLKSVRSKASFELMAFLAGDGVFSEQKDGNIILVDLKSGTNRTLVSAKDVTDVSTLTVSRLQH